MFNVWTVAALGALLLVAGGVLALVALPQAQTSGEMALDGLSAPVEVVRDRWGVPHLYARNAEDLFFAQGFVTAQDRLWQMELARRAGAGRLSELFGEATLAADRVLRTLGLNHAAEAAAAQLGSEAAPLVNAYVRGINASIEARGGRWPLEFVLLGAAPEPWVVEDVFAVAGAMALTLQDYFYTIVRRARALDALDPARFAELNAPFSTAGTFLVDAQGNGVIGDPAQDGERVDSLVPANAGSLATQRGATRWVAALEKAARALAQAAALAPAGSGLGSNNWAVSGTRTASGFPLLANDPHLAPRQPATWYEVHLNAPGWAVAGASLPGVPGVAIGHNESIAWGVTVAYLAVQDLFVEEFDPADPARYRTPEGWADAQTRVEAIRVKGHAEPVRHTVVSTHHGPLVTDVLGGAQPLALGWTFLDPAGSDQLGGLLAINRATNWDEFRRGVSQWAFDLNFVFADVAGNIGYQLSGRLPQRPLPYTGLPVPGAAGAHDWAGIVPFEQMPHALNPETGFVVTANAQPASDGYEPQIAGEWSAPFRARRIAEVLGAGAAFTLEDMRALQADGAAEAYARLQRLLLAHVPPENALEAVRAWDAVVREESEAALLVDATARAWVAQTFRVLGPEPHFADLQRGVSLLLDWAEADPDAPWFDDPQTAARETVTESLRAAFSTAREAVAALPPGRRTWGAARAVTFSHPLGGLPLVGELFNRRSSTAGGRFTVNRENTSYRLLVDLGDWEAARSGLTTGQSGHPFSAHYADQLDAWRTVQPHPMPWGRAAVDAVAASTLWLRPAHPAQP